MSTIDQIKEEMKSKNELLIDFYFNDSNSKYFNDLVRELPNFNVNEIRPLQKIRIAKGIESKILYQYLGQMKSHIMSYNKLRILVFYEFLASLKIDEIEGKFFKLREKLEKIKKWPKGIYKEWSYWSHGSDIEFDNNETGCHFNVQMANINALAYWSVHRYICNTLDQSLETKFIMDNKDAIPKIFDLMVLQNDLKVERTQYGEKHYILTI